jgi:DUF177 domain-containing protein
MLLLNLKTIRTAHERFERVYPADAFGGDLDGFRVVAPVALEFDIHKDKDQFHLVGSVKTTVELACSRCLDAFTWPIDAAFDLRYHPFAPAATEGEQEIEEDDLTTAFYEHDTIDLGQLMREQFYLSVPMKPLCGGACHGLCPMCGTNLNRERCECKREWDDPRLAALRALKVEHEKIREHN